MTVSNENPSVLSRSDSIDKARLERAWRAVQEGNRMHGQLQSFIRVVAENSTINLKFTSGAPRTDNKTVWLRVPIEMGDRLVHDTSVCGQRDPVTLQKICVACKAREDILAQLFHECAHIVKDSFASLTDDEKTELVTRVVNERPAISTTRLGKLQAKIEKLSNPNYVLVNQIISPYLPMIFNALEDARVNRAMYHSRAGTEIWFKAHAYDAFNNGIPDEQGNILKWNEAGDNSQVIIGLLCKASNFDYQGWFKPEIVEALDDLELTKLINRLDSARTVAGTYRIGFPVLERLRELGFCKRYNEPEDDPKPGKPGDPGGQPNQEQYASPSDDEGESESGSQGGTVAPEDWLEGEDPDDDETSPNGSTDGSGTEDADDEDDAVDDESGTSDDESDDDTEDADDEDERTSDDDAQEDAEQIEKQLAIFGGHAEVNKTSQQEKDDEAVSVATLQSEKFDTPSAVCRDVYVHKFQVESDRSPVGWTGFNRAELVTPSELLLSKALFNMRKTFAFNKASQRDPGLRHGHLHGPSLHRVPTGDKKVFTRTVQPKRRDYAVTIGLDISGSTSGRVLDGIKLAGACMAELLSRTGVAFQLAAHTGMWVNYPVLGVDIHEVKSFDESWGRHQRQALTALNGDGYNLDGHTLEYYRKSVMTQQTTDRLIIYFTDGEMPYMNEEDETVVLKREIEMCRKLGIMLLGVGWRTDSPKAHGLDTVIINSEADIPTLINEIDRRLTR